MQNDALMQREGLKGFMTKYTSTTLAQQWTNAGPTSHVCWVVTTYICQVYEHLALVFCEQAVGQDTVMTLQLLPLWRHLDTVILVILTEPLLELVVTGSKKTAVKRVGVPLSLKQNERD